MHDDLKQRLRDEVDAELGSRPPRNLPDVLTRGRSKRFTLRLVAAASMLLLGTALVVGGFWIAGSLSTERTSIPPAGENASPTQPTPRETSEDAEGYDILDGEVTFRAAEPWEPHTESLMIAKGPLPTVFTLWTRFDDTDTSCRSPRSSCADFTVVADPAPRQESCALTGGTVVSAEALADAIGAHPGLESTDPVSERIGGIDGVRLDIAAAEGALTCEESGGGIEYGDGVPVLTATRPTKLGAPVVAVVEPGTRMRVYLFDLPEGAAARTLAIMLVAREADFDVAVEAAKPILDSFEFQVTQ